jgi:hypothetical protein
MKATALLLMLAAGMAQADDTLWDFLPELPPTSEITLSTGADSANGWNSQISALLEGPQAVQFSMMLGTSKTVGDNASLRTDFWSAGIGSDPLGDFSIGLDYSVWGNEHAMTIHSVRATFGFNSDHFSLTLSPQQRTIRLRLKEPYSQQRPHWQEESQDIGITATWYALPDWSFSSNYIQYHYTANPVRLATDYRAALIFSQDTLQLASGLDDNRMVLGVNHYLEKTVLGGEWARSLSAVDNSTATTVTLLISTERSRSWRLDLHGGVQNTEYNDSAILFADIGVAYRW